MTYLNDLEPADIVTAHHLCGEFTKRELQDAILVLIQDAPDDELVGQTFERLGLSDDDIAREILKGRMKA